MSEPRGSIRPDPVIVVRTPNWLGDTVMALPALVALRAAEPRARITLAGRWAPLLGGQGVADLLLAYPHTLRERLAFGRALGREPADLAVLLPNSVESALAAWRWGARRRLGFDTDGRGPLLTDRVPLPAPRLHQVDEYTALLGAAGVDGAEAVPAWRLQKDAEADAEVSRLLADAGFEGGAAPVGLHLGAAFGSSKLWPAAAFGRLAAGLLAEGFRPVFLGTAGDVTTATAAVAAAGAPVPSLVGRDRPALLPRLLSRLACLVSGDTGVAHLAAAVGIATVTLFGPTDKRRTAPRGHGARALDCAVPCAPCFLPACPIDHVCLRRIDPETVLDEVKGVVPA